jgi:anti-anti-sigma factor
MSAADHNTEPRLELTRSATGAGAVRLALTGEIDIGTVDLFRDRVADVLSEDRVTSVVLDFGELRFLDSSGIATLIGARRQAEERGVGVWIVNCHGTVRHVLEVTGVYDVFAAEGQPAEDPA